MGVVEDTDGYVTIIEEGPADEPQKLITHVVRADEAPFYIKTPR